MQCCHSVNIVETTNVLWSVSQNGHQIARCRSILCSMLCSSAICGGKLKAPLVPGEYSVAIVHERISLLHYFECTKCPFAATWESGITAPVTENSGFRISICLSYLLIKTGRFDIAIAKAQHLTRIWPVPIPRQQYPFTLMLFAHLFLGFSIWRRPTQVVPPPPILYKAFMSLSLT
jgi:hypothetical protein